MKTLLDLVLITLVTAQLDIRDRCGRENKGICYLVEGCPSAIELIKARQQHKLEHCGWKGRTQIVCCMEDENKNPIDVRNPSEQREKECIRFGEQKFKATTPFIYNGKELKPGEYPHMAALGYESSNRSFPYDWRCGGSLISENYVLTAAHCLRVCPSIVRLGKIDLHGNEDKVEPQDIPVEECIPHDDYDHLKKLNDIALLRLSKPAEITKYVRPVCLYTKSDTPPGLFIAGWGVTKRDGELSRFLQGAAVAPVDLDACNVAFSNSPIKRKILPSQICAIGDKEAVTDTCQGDSGGPIQTQNRKGDGTEYQVIGVTSFGLGCASKTPGVYTRVFSYLDWIERKVWS